ncbi:MAG: SpoIIE family protein phosphatase [Acidobacteria bacterium]|nr:SpoIIE family protein phosphatase [Acidobacteriota bacterium]
MSRIWLVPAFAIPVGAQSALHLDLSGEWRPKTRDDTAFAQSGFDGYAWQRVNLPTLESPPNGVSWLRRQVTLPEWVDTSQLTLTLGTFAETYVVYCNGIRIERAGQRGEPNAQTSLSLPRTCAGHLAPYGNGRALAVEPGLALGITVDAVCAENVAQGDCFTVVSDGVVEAANPKGALFGFERTREISRMSTPGIAESAKAWGRNDDITVVTIRRAG